MEHDESELEHIDRSFHFKVQGLVNGRLHKFGVGTIEIKPSWFVPSDVENVLCFDVGQVVEDPHCQLDRPIRGK